MSSDNPQSNYAIELPEDAVRRACRKIYEALESYWEEQKQEGTFADYVESVERAADIKDDRLRAAWVAAVSVEAAWVNMEMNRSGRDALGSLFEALDAWEEHLSYAWYCVGLMRGPRLDLTPTDLSRKLLDLRHKRAREAKARTQDLYLNFYKPKCISKAKAALEIWEKLKDEYEYPPRKYEEWLTGL